MESIEQQLEKIEEAKKSIQVKKAIPLSIDLGILTATDINPLDETKFSNLGEDLDNYLREYCRDGLQLLLNEVFQLPVVGTDEGYMATLPTRKLPLPREKPVPKPKPMTRWEKFAKAKGITKKKRERMVYDEASGEYRPRYGYKGINQVGQDWLMEVPENADPDTDMYAKEREEKKSRIERNLQRQLRNAREAEGNKKNAFEEREKRKDDLHRDAVLAKISTASMGKFDKQIEGEAKAKGVKRKFEPTAKKDLGDEKKTNLKIINKLVDGSAAKARQKAEVVNVRKAINANGGLASAATDKSKASSKGSKGKAKGKGKK